MSRPPYRAIAGLGAATIIAFGSWFYAYTVLIDPIAADTGWTVGFLSAVYGIAQLVGSILAVAGGRALDRIGARPAMAAGGLLGGIAIVLAAAGGPAAFAVGFGLGGGLIGATSFYHVTLAAAARFDETRPERSVTAVTIAGAFAGPIFLPITALLVEGVGWVATVRILGAVAGGGLLLSALLTPGGGSAGRDISEAGLWTVFRDAWAHPPSRLKLIAAPVAALGYGILLVHQIPVMVAAGMTLTTAAAYTGARGFTQLGGRLIVVPVVRRIGSAPTMIGTYLIGAAGAAILLWTDNTAVAVIYTVAAGLAIGVGPVLDAVYSAEIYDSTRLGTLMGAQQLLSGMVMAIGPIIAGVAFDITGSHAITVTLSAIGFTAAAFMIGRVARAVQPPG